MEVNGWRPRLQGTARTYEEQQKHFAAGRSKLSGDKAPHVHQLNGRPASFATHVLNDDNPLGESPHFFAELAVEASFVQLETGLLWGLKGDERAERAIALLFARSAELAEFIKVKRGWDPVHVQYPAWREQWGRERLPMLYKERS
jgi:hypothetical protein